MDIKASNNVGGLIGYASEYVNITNSYAIGNIVCSSTVGGLVAGSTVASTIDVVSSYWDIETTGQDTSKFGTGLTTEKMKTQSSYSEWNFTSIWKMGENGYPTLQ